MDEWALICAAVASFVAPWLYELLKEVLPNTNKLTSRGLYTVLVAILMVVAWWISSGDPETLKSWALATMAPVFGPATGYAIARPKR